MAQRTIGPCSGCRGRGRTITGYGNDGVPRFGGRCPRCEGVGFLPLLHGRPVTWATARGIMDRESATPVANGPRVQGSLL
jgi:hypothetical protein